MHYEKKLAVSKTEVHSIALKYVNEGLRED
jgi:hypothetical protein